MKGATVTVADRLAQIVLSLYQAETLSVDIIRRQCFGADRRTAYRDLNLLVPIMENVGQGTQCLSAHLTGQYNVKYLLTMTWRAGVSAFNPRQKLKNHYPCMHQSGLLTCQYSHQKSPLRRAFFDSALTENDADEGRKMKAEFDLQGSAARADVHLNECHLFPFQRIIKAFDNGDLLLSSYIDSSEEFSLLVQDWISHRIIISPQAWQNNVKERIAARCNVT